MNRLPEVIDAKVLSMVRVRDMAHRRRSVRVVGWSRTAGWRIAWAVAALALAVRRRRGDFGNHYLTTGFDGRHRLLKARGGNAPGRSVSPVSISSVSALQSY